MENTTIRTRRAPLIVGGVALVALVAAAAILRINRGAADYDPATAEGVAQRYLQAVIDGDRRAALDYFSADLRAACRSTSTEIAGRDAVRATLGGVYATGDYAEVAITITEANFEGPLLAERSFDITLVMSRAGDGWVISEPPWPMAGCEVRSTP